MSDLSRRGVMMDKDRKKGIIILVLIGIAFLFFFSMIFIMNKWYFKLIFGILSVIPAAILIRTYLGYKRKKLAFTGKVLQIKKPDQKFMQKWTVIMKNGKISKKFYSLEQPDMRVGRTYGVFYEEKSNLILQIENPEFQIMSATDIKSNPKFR